MHIGYRISRILQERGWSQAELARKSGVTRQAIWNIINGQDPSLALLRRLAAELGVTESDLLEGSPWNDAA